MTNGNHGQRHPDDSDVKRRTTLITLAHRCLLCLVSHFPSQSLQMVYPPQSLWTTQLATTNKCIILFAGFIRDDFYAIGWLRAGHGLRQRHPEWRQCLQTGSSRTERNLLLQGTKHVRTLEVMQTCPQRILQYPSYHVSPVNIFPLLHGALHLHCQTFTDSYATPGEYLLTLTKIHQTYIFCDLLIYSCSTLYLMV